MQQHDGAVVDAGQQLVKGLLSGGLVVGVPVDVGKAPEHGFVAERLCHFKVALAELALWRPVDFLHLLTRHLFIERFKVGELFFKRGFVCNAAHVGVGVGVVEVLVQEA